MLLPSTSSPWRRNLLQASRFLLLALTFSTLAACNTLTTLDGRPVEELSAASPTQRLLRPCAEPQQLPRRAISRSEVVRAWARDRVSLADCGDRHDAVVQFYAERDAGLAGPIK